jgi:uncharacterized protein (TIGR03083 family)
VGLPVIDTRPHFRPLCREIVALLRTLQPDDWERPTMASAWRVRDVAAHMCDTALRRLSLHRDRRMPPSGPRGTGERDLTLFINELNAAWIRTAERFSPRVLTELYAHASNNLVAFIETLDPLADAMLPVSWAGQSASPQWLDIGREFTEIWHHGSQIREAVGAVEDGQELFAVPPRLEEAEEFPKDDRPRNYRESDQQDEHRFFDAARFAQRLADHVPKCVFGQ